MKVKLFLIGIVLLIVAIGLIFATMVRNSVAELSVYYLNVRVLGPYVEIASDSENKDKACKFIYAYSGRVIVDSRNGMIGRIASNRLEKKGPLFSEDRLNAEKYLKREQVE